ncbi:LysR family transcriptional regulator [Pseudomonas sp. FME51]|uniref:LysR family transcriptional regulator n=1 Tax=Pseudomonas sp. FME51 TaxID=2742609 RepID=UPI001867F34C|nr:LysR family transcriptional regulator [Pseudomonas sp. FME51]
MDIKDLKMLVAVVEAGSMSSAAQRLYTSRSNISRQLKKLESDFRVQIFRRTTRQLEPTQIGWAMYEHAVKVTQELNALEATVRDMGRSLRGHVRVSVPIGLGQLALGEVLLEFCKLHPDVTIQITFNNRIFDLLEEEVDISIRIANSPPGSYVARELSDVEWVACVSSPYVEQHGNPATPEELVGHHLVTPPVRNNRLILGFLSGQQRHVIELMPKLQCADMIFLKRSVILGSGIGVLPYYLISDELKDGTLVRSLPDYSPDPKIWGDKIFLITAPSLYPSQMVRALMDYLKQAFSDEGAVGALMKGQFGGARHPPSGT